MGQGGGLYFSDLRHWGHDLSDLTQTVALLDEGRLPLGATFLGWVGGLAGAMVQTPQ